MRGWMGHHAYYDKHSSFKYILECLIRGESLPCVLDEEARNEILGRLRDLVELRLVEIVLRAGDIAAGR